MAEENGKPAGIALGYFQDQVKGMLNGKAKDKGYSPSADESSELYQFVSHAFGGHPHAHALGEIVYKAVRYAHTGNRDDLVKIASWAFIIQREGG